MCSICTLIWAMHIVKLRSHLPDPMVTLIKSYASSTDTVTEAPHKLLCSCGHQTDWMYGKKIKKGLRSNSYHTQSRCFWYSGRWIPHKIHGTLLHSSRYRSEKVVKWKKYHLGFMIKTWLYLSRETVLRGQRHKSPLLCTDTPLASYSHPFPATQ